MLADAGGPPLLLGEGEWRDPTRISLRRLDRTLHKQERSLYNCINSILHDAIFVDEVRCLYAGVPVLANLRCGLWYAKNSEATCYFKSTDGHNNNWSFSTTRLNLHVAHIAARRDGVLIVDATRKGKMAPDAFSKTIPIWACVLNRAVAAWRAEQDPTTAAAPASGAEEWDCSLHLPLWISEVERMSIEARLPAFVEQLCKVGADVGGLSAELHRPLRPLWVSPSTRMWTNRMPELSSLGFTPLVLLSASAQVPASQEAGSCLWRSVRLGPPGALADEDGERPLSQSRTYRYIPGAGDDEETWAAGSAWWPPGQMACRLRWQSCWQRSPQRRMEAPAPMATDGHHPLPMGLGVSSTAPQGAYTDVGQVWWVGESGLALGSHASGCGPGVWQVVDAVLNCGSRQHTCHEADDTEGQRYLWLRVQPAKVDRLGLLRSLAQALAFIWPVLRGGGRVLVHCDTGFDTCVAVAVAVMICRRARDKEGSTPTPARFPLPAGEVTRDHVKQQLAEVCMHYPIARPTRGMLKQVYNFFIQRQGGSAANAADYPADATQR